MKIYLLTHQRELDRKTNTGQLVLNCLGNHAKRILWERANPNQELIELIQKNKIALLYPGENTKPLDLITCENILLIDSTWQEANKIYNRSPYLKEAEKFAIETNSVSVYKRRKNQKIGGLCTAECVIALLKTKGRTEQVKNLENEFTRFNLRL